MKRAFALLLLSALLTAIGAEARAAACTWIATAAGDWENGDNWDCEGENRVPEPGDAVTIGTAPQAGRHVTINSIAHVAQLTLSANRRLIIKGSLLVDGDMTWTCCGIDNGELSDAPNGTLKVQGQLSMFGTSNVSINRIDLEVVGGGILDHSGNARLAVGTNASFTNGELLLIAGGTGMSGRGTFINDGALIKVGADNLFFVDPTFNNNGTVSVATGTIAFQNEGTFNGTLHAADGAAIEFGNRGGGGLGSNATFQMNGTWTGDGAYNFVLGTLTLLSPLTVPAATTFRHERGTLAVEAPFVIDGEMQWFNGTITGSDPITIAPGGLFTGLNPPLGSVKKLDGAEIFNEGSWVQNNPMGITFENGSNITNRPGGLVNVKVGTLFMQGGVVFDNQGIVQIESGGISISGSGADPEFRNSGTVRGDGSVQILGAAFVNTGTFAPERAVGGAVLPGILHVSSYVNGTLEIDAVSGTGPGTGHDQLNVGLTAVLGGALGVDASDLAEPGEFVILTCGNTPPCIEGTFATATIDGPYGMEVQYNPSNVTLIVAGPPTLVVNSTGDDPDLDPGDGNCDTGGTIDRDGVPEPECTLRAALTQHNAGGGPGRIEFDIPGAGPHVISPASLLPGITQRVTITGSGELEIVISGSAAGAAADGLLVGSAAGASVLENLVVTEFGGHGIVVAGASTVLRGNDVSGNGGSGVAITEGAATVLVGGDVPADRNTISANGRYGVEVADGIGARVVGNWIGLHLPGLTDPNVLGGVFLGGDGEHVVGGTTPTAGEPPGNVFEGNGPEGSVVIGSDGNVVRGNLIGRLPSAARASGSRSAGFRAESGNQGPGVSIEGADNQIGGESAEDANVIAGNDGSGVIVVGNPSVGNTIRRNVIYGNAGLAIDLGADGPTPNDLGDGVNDIDADAGPNDLLNFPVALTVNVDRFNPGQVIISGVLDTPDPQNAIIEIYSSEEASTVEAGTTRFGQAQVFVDTTRARASGVIRKRLPVGSIPHPILSATATDADGSTSEFSWVCYDTTGDGSVDSDGDSLCDNWEAHGIDYDGDGVIDLDLPALGANPAERDLFVEVDWMTGHEPIQAGLDDVRNAFASAPSPIHLRTLKDEEIPLIDPLRFRTGADPAGSFQAVKHGNPVQPCGAGASAGRFGTAADRAAATCVARIGARRLVYRYAIFGRRYAESPGSSGIGEVFGKDFLVTIGSWDEEDVRAASGLGPGAAMADARRIIEASTYMHEMGHTLGFSHGGWDERNCKPNYPSVMSYTLQFPELVPLRVMDYSRGAMSALDEAALDERAGLDGPADRVAIWRTEGVGGAPPRLLFTSALSPRVDWNGDALISAATVAVDVNHIPASGCATPNEAGHTALNGFDDWARVTLDFRSYRDFAAGASPELPDDHLHERTDEEVVAAALEADFDRDGIPNALDNCPAIYNPDQTDTSGNGIGDACEGPMADVAVHQEDHLDDVTAVLALTVYNFGPERATDVVLADTLSTVFVIDDVVAPSADCTVDGQVLGCTVAEIAAGDSVQVILTGSMLEQGTFENTAHVAYTFDPNPYNNAFTLEVGAGGVSTELPSDVPRRFRLHASHPNPFRGSTVITFDLAEPAPVRLEVFDLLGRRVALVVDERREEGRHAVTFDATGLGPGVYVYRLEAGAHQAARRFTVLR